MLPPNFFPRFRRIVAVSWIAFRPTLLTLTILALIIALAYFRAGREARRSFQTGAFSRAATLLRPWFAAGLLGQEPTKMLMQALLNSGGDPLTAAAAGEDCILREPQAVGCALGISDAFVQTGRFTEAQNLLMNILTGFGSQPQVHLKVAELAAKTGREALAVAEFQAALSGVSGQERAHVLTRLTSYLNTLNRHSDASHYAQELFDLSQEKSVEGMLVAAETWDRVGKQDDFLKAMRAAQSQLGTSRAAPIVALNYPRLFAKFNAYLRGETQPPAVSSSQPRPEASLEKNSRSRR